MYFIGTKINFKTTLVHLHTHVVLKEVHIFIKYIFVIVKCSLFKEVPNIVHYLYG